jgi:hypothetical protein
MYTGCWKQQETETDPELADATLLAFGVVYTCEVWWLTSTTSAHLAERAAQPK